MKKVMGNMCLLERLVCVTTNQRAAWGIQMSICYVGLSLLVAKCSCSTAKTHTKYVILVTG